MVGNRAGGIRAAKTNKEKYGEDFYKIQGAKGGSVCCKKGFSVNPALASIAGVKGGRISRRGPAKHKKVKVEVNTETD